MTIAQTAAVGAGILIAGVGVFQLALALGLPLGEATLGGRAPTVDGVLSPAFRAIAATSALALVLVAWVVLARAGVVPPGPVSPTVLVWLTWGIAAFLVLNTIGNLAAPHPVERWVMGPITLAVVLLVGGVVARAPESLIGS